MPRVFLALAAFALMCSHSSAQDDQSLGDLARQVRAQKQQKAAQSKDTTKSGKSVSETADIIANDTTQSKAQGSTSEEAQGQVGAKTGSSSHSDSKDSDAKDSKSSDSVLNPADREAQAENWKSQILQQKETIAELQQQIEQVSGSIQYAGANCVSNCEKWNEHQQRKQGQVDTMKSQLEELQHHLEEMQESARKQGFGSSVYEP
jgi:chromosome segregation ATPase